MLSRKGQTTDLEWRILKCHHCCVICPVPILCPKTWALGKSKDVALVRLLLLCSPEALMPERVSPAETDVCRLSAWETRCAVGWRGSGSQSAISGSLKVLAHDLGKGTQPLPACVSFPVYIACTPFRQSLLQLCFQYWKSPSPHLWRRGMAMSFKGYGP